MLVPISYLIFWAVLLGFSLYSEPVVCGLGMVIMLTGVPVYFVGVQWKEKPKWIYRFIGESFFLKICVFLNCVCARLQRPPVLQRESHTWARSCATWCFLRTTPQRLNPSLPKPLTEPRSQPGLHFLPRHLQVSVSRPHCSTVVKRGLHACRCC